MAASGQQIVDRWKAAMQSGQTAQKYRDGINGFNGNPMAMAATPQALQKYASNTAAAAQPGGKMQTKLMAANPATWKANASGPGATNLQTGAMKGLAKVQAASAKVAQAGADGQAAAANATGAVAKMIANMNAIRAAHGYGSLG